MYYDKTSSYEYDQSDDSSLENESQTTIEAFDKNYFSYKIPYGRYGPDGKFHKNKRLTIHNYGSGGTGSEIRNAVNGFGTGYTVGSANEDLFFKVIDATGINYKREPFVLFYDSPEQYERHHHTVVSNKSKERWNKKFLEAKARL